MNNHPWKILALALILAACGGETQPVANDADFNGRWNLTVPGNAQARAWWLEVEGAGGAALKGRFVGAPGGGMYDIPEMSITDGELTFAFPDRKDSPRGAELPSRKGVYKARLESGKLVGYQSMDGDNVVKQEFTGERAPEITDKDDGTWKPGEPVELFNGKDLSGWLPMIAGKELGWTVNDGILVNTPHANNLVSEAKFWNFKLHAEYRLVEGSNSGLGLRGRYEVQLLADHGREPSKGGHGAIYSRIVPSKNASKPAGEWQTLDVTLIGRDVTVVLNGETVIDKAEIEGLTAMGHDPHEDQPGPISLQGDHRQVEVRKLTVTPLTQG